MNRTAWAMTVLLGLTTQVAAAAEPSLNFARDVLPILAKNCFACHGPDDSHREAELRLDIRDGALAQLPSGERAVVVGKPDESELPARVLSTDADLRMPPAKHGPPLSSEQIDVLRRWIVEGASYAPHWSFVPPVQAPPPAVKNAAWPRNDLDRFILAKLEAVDLPPNPEAEAAILCRRLYLDLIGLPPTPEQVTEFVKGYAPSLPHTLSPSAVKEGVSERESEGAKKRTYEATVDALLASEHFGERWARLWLDVARYADSRGYGSDPLRPNIWPYRDWVVRAFNRNLPYDEFVIEQLAGDLLPNATDEQRLATAFHRNTMTNTEGGTDDEEFRVAAVNDRTHVTFQAFMGLTMGCAKCHNHKYDPITQREYYRAFAVFNQTEDNDQPNESPTMTLPDELESKKKQERDRINLELPPLKKKLDELKAAMKPELPKVDADKLQKDTDDVRKQVREMESKLEALKPLSVPVMKELAKDKQRKSFILVKGNFLVKGEPVESGLPLAFHKPTEGTPDRLALARWIVDQNNPLTARVAVNRTWAALFGTGLVETEEDFGIQGAAPSHAELLDWLAVRFAKGCQETGDRTQGAVGEVSPVPCSLSPSEPWDFKQFLKLIVSSAAYRQSSRVSPEALKLDPRNRLLGRAPRYRLEAELVRDQALALSGLLSEKIGGPSVFPPQPAGLWQAAFNGERTWTTSQGEDRYRRGLYTFWRRTVPYPSMATFDAPSRETCSVRRIRTNTPLQALVTLNDPVYVEAAQSLARRILRDGGSSTDERIRYALRLCTCREPQAEQVAALTKLFDDELQHYRNDAKAAEKLATAPLGSLPEGMNTAEAAAWTVVANVLLNLDAVLTRS